MQTLIGAQDQFITVINTAWQRWAHRKGFHGEPGGHFPRIHGAARRRLRSVLTGMGWTAEQAKQAIRDAEEVAALERNADAA